ncbi:transposase [Streptomyces sp. NPDC057238]|uniref:transposase n=1 Tax=Streptomyces sp. NPDC057238 TaxID=3346060 RepID=UPI0036433A99
MSDTEWVVVKNLLPVPGWPAGRGGWPEGYCHRQMIDAVRYLVDNGIKWRAVPSDFPPWPRVYALFARRRDTGLAAELHDRPHQAVRRAEGRDPEPSGAVVDSQLVKADATVAHASEVVLFPHTRFGKRTTSEVTSLPVRLSTATGCPLRGPALRVTEMIYGYENLARAGKARTPTRGQELWEALRTRLHASCLFAGLDPDEQDALLGLLTKTQRSQRP